MRERTWSSCDLNSGCSQAVYMYLATRPYPGLDVGSLVGLAWSCWVLIYGAARFR